MPYPDSSAEHELPSNDEIGGILQGVSWHTMSCEDAAAEIERITREQIARDIEAHIATEPTLMHVVDWRDGMETAVTIARDGAA